MGSSKPLWAIPRSRMVKEPKFWAARKTERPEFLVSRFLLVFIKPKFWVWNNQSSGLRSAPVLGRGRAGGKVDSEATVTMGWFRACLLRGSPFDKRTLGAPLLCGASPRLARHKHRHDGPAKHSGCGSTKDKLPQSAMAIGTHHQKVRLL